VNLEEAVVKARKDPVWFARLFLNFTPTL